jgi:hypothetical protein
MTIGRLKGISIDFSQGRQNRRSFIAIAAENGHNIPTSFERLGIEPR